MPLHSTRLANRVGSLFAAFFRDAAILLYSLPARLLSSLSSSGGEAEPGIHFTARTKSLDLVLLVQMLNLIFKLHNSHPPKLSEERPKKKSKRRHHRTH